MENLIFLKERYAKLFEDFVMMEHHISNLREESNVDNDFIVSRVINESHSKMNQRFFHLVENCDDSVVDSLFYAIIMNGKHSLHLACRYNWKHMATYIIHRTQNKELIHSKTENHAEITALNICSRKRNYSIFSCILEHTANAEDLYSASSDAIEPLRLCLIRKDEQKCLDIVKKTTNAHHFYKPCNVYINYFILAIRQKMNKVVLEMIRHTYSFHYIKRLIKTIYKRTPFPFYQFKFVWEEILNKCDYYTRILKLKMARALESRLHRIPYEIYDSIYAFLDWRTPLIETITL